MHIFMPNMEFKIFFFYLLSEVSGVIRSGNFWIKCFENSWALIGFVSETRRCYLLEK